MFDVLCYLMEYSLPRLIAFMHSPMFYNLVFYRGNTEVGRCSVIMIMLLTVAEIEGELSGFNHLLMFE